MTDYDTDIAAWAEEQAALLRRRASNELDWEHLAEEIEGVSASQKGEVRSRLALICQHLLKWQHQSEHRSRSGRNTIRTQRDELDDVLQDSPSLRPYAAAALAKAFAKGRDRAEDETGVLRLPGDCPWAIGQVFDPEFWPGGKDL